MADNHRNQHDPTDAAGARPQTDRAKYRDNDDVRDPTLPAARSDNRPDTRSEARGTARENVGNTAGGTDADPSGPEGNDRTRSRDDREDEFDADLTQGD